MKSVKLKTKNIDNKKKPLLKCRLTIVSMNTSQITIYQYFKICLNVP